MGSVLDQERPWEREARLERYRTMDINELKRQIDEVLNVPWEHVALKEAQDIYDIRMKEFNKG